MSKLDPNPPLLADLIDAGLTLGLEQGKNAYFSDEEESVLLPYSENITRACVMGTAYLGAGKSGIDFDAIGLPFHAYGVMMALHEVCGIEQAHDFVHPITGRETALYDIMLDLNDVHGWSRELIALWLRSLPELVGVKNQDVDL